MAEGLVGVHRHPGDPAAARLADPTPDARTVTVNPAAPTLSEVQCSIFTPRCVACHAVPGAVAQGSTPPPCCGTVDTLVVASCTDDGTTSEDWNDDGRGLDNDGDMLHDRDDPAGQAGFLLHDTFASGDASGWSGAAASPAP